MRVELLAAGVVIAVAGAALAAGGTVRQAADEAYDPTVDVAVGDVRILAYGREPWLLPREMHRGSAYDVYDRTFEAVAIPDGVERVEFAVHLTLAPEGSVPYPFLPEHLPAAESYSGAHLQGSPWVPPYTDDVHVVEASHTFTREGETWRARMTLDTGDLPPGERFDYVLGTYYVAHLADGTTRDLQGIGGAGEAHAVTVVDGDAVGRFLQQGGLLSGALVSAVGTAVGAWGAFGRRGPA